MKWGCKYIVNTLVSALVGLRVLRRTDRQTEGFKLVSLVLRSWDVFYSRKWSMENHQGGEI